MASDLPKHPPKYLPKHLPNYIYSNFLGGYLNNHLIGGKANGPLGAIMPTPAQRFTGIGGWKGELNERM